MESLPNYDSWKTGSVQNAESAAKSRALLEAQECRRQLEADAEWERKHGAEHRRKLAELRAKKETP